MIGSVRTFLLLSSLYCIVEDVLFVSSSRWEADVSTRRYSYQYHGSRLNEVCAFVARTTTTTPQTSRTLQRRQCPFPSTSFAPLASKKKGATTQGTASKKIQVKLLKQVAGTGQKGDVVMVTPAFYQNMLRPTHLAEIISDDEVERERAAAEAMEKKNIENANTLKEQIENLELSITRKAGPDGQLFGGVGPKMIMDELRNQIDQDHTNKFFDQKSVKIDTIVDDSGKKMRGDIKHTGEFEAKIILMKDISAKFKIKVVSE